MKNMTNGKLYLTIDKDWFEKNKEKLNKEFAKIYSGTDATELEESWHFEISHKFTISYDVDNNTLDTCTDYEGNNKDGFYVSVESKLKDDLTVSIVQATIDDLQGDAFAEIVGVIVKKFNKFKSALESIKGL